MSASRMRRLYVFDMDGTLLPGTTACGELAKETNTSQQLESIEREFREGRLDTKGFASHIHALWGTLEPKTVAAAFHRSPKLQNIRKVLDHISRTQNLTCLITMSPNFFARQFASYGFDYIFSSRFPTGNERLDLGEILTPSDKPRLAKEICRREGLPFEESAAFGDSMSDMDLFQLLRYTVSVNGTPEIARHALVRYQGCDLYDAYDRLLQAMHMVTPDKSTVSEWQCSNSARRE